MEIKNISKIEIKWLVRTKTLINMENIPFITCQRKYLGVGHGVTVWNLMFWVNYPFNS